MAADNKVQKKLTLKVSTFEKSAILSYHEFTFSVVAVVYNYKLITCII